MKDSLTKYYVTGFRKTVNSTTENKVFSSDRPFSKEHLCCMFFDEGWQIATLKGGYEINIEEMALEEKQPSPSPTVEISLEDAKKIKELHDIFLIFLIESDPTRYHYIEACYNEKHYKAKVLSEAISKAESQWWGTTEIEQFRESEKINFDNMSKKAGGLNVPSPAIQDQVNELRKKVDDVQTRLSEIASTVSRSNLSQHIRLGGVEPNNL